MRHSRLGIASFIISVIAPVSVFWILVIVVYQTHGTDTTSYHSLMLGLGMVMLVAFFAIVAALGLGIAALCQQGEKKIFAIVGIVFSLATVIVPCIALAAQHFAQLEGFHVTKQETGRGTTLLRLTSTTDGSSIAIYRDKKSGRVVSYELKDRPGTMLLLKPKDGVFWSLFIDKGSGSEEIQSEDLGVKGQSDIRSVGNQVDVTVDGVVYHGKIVAGNDIVQKDGRDYRADVRDGPSTLKVNLIPVPTPTPPNQ